MTRQEFNSAFTKMAAVFPSDRITQATNEVYWEMLGEIPSEIWAKGVQTCISNCKFFPAVNELGVACFGEEKGGMVEKCDPWRTRQFFKEYIEAESWRQRLTKHLKQLESPSRKKIA